MLDLDNDEQLQYHIDSAERLLAHCRDVPNSYAPACITYAQAATAHAILAQTLISLHAAKVAV